jgi:glycosyltransferase involved in cell wall biosynthesis
VRIGLMAYLLHGGSDYRAAGVSTYILNLMRCLPRVRPENVYIVFQGRDAPFVAGVEPITSAAPTWKPLVRIFCEQAVLPIEYPRARLDVLHGTVNVVPLLAMVPAVVTIHDLSFLHVPDRFAPAKVAYLTRLVKWSTRHATHVIAVSEYTRNDLIRSFDLDESRVSVVYSGVDPGFRPVSLDESTEIRQKTTAGRPYILHVGTLEPRKNIDVLLRAFAACRREDDIPHLLVLVGAKGWMYSRLFALTHDLGLEDHVRFVDYVRPETLPLWYNGADVLVYPSAYEGFGLPVLEAMASGLPVITSASSAMSELAGGACLTVAPGSQEALQLALARMLTQTDLRASLRRAGLERAARFSWERCATETASVYDLCAART